MRVAVSNIGTKGLNTDVNKSELPAEFITSGSNFRVKNASIESLSSSELLSVPPVHFNAGHVRFVDTTTGGFFLVLGRSAAYAFDGGVWFDISSVFGYGALGTDDELQWSSAFLGNIPIVNHPLTEPEFWSPQSGAQILQPLPFSPGMSFDDVGKSMRIIRSHKTYLFALNLTESGIELPNSYRWSHPADNNALPFTWDETDPSAIASIEQILGDSGQIVDGLSLRDSFVIYSERGINILDEVGLPSVFANRELSTTYGLVSPETLVEVESVHYFLSDGDILRNDGNRVMSIAHNVIRNRLNSNLNINFYSRSFTRVNQADKEIWFCVPEGVSEYANTAFIYNWVDQSWAIKNIAENIADFTYGQLEIAPLTWATITGTWATITGTWAGNNNAPLNSTLVGVDTTDSSLVVVNPLSTSGALDLNATIERTDYPMNDRMQVNTVTSVIPHMSAQGEVDIQIGSQQFEGGPVTWEVPVRFNPSIMRKVDVRSTGELHAWRVISVDNIPWSLSGFTFEFQPAGLR